MKIQNRARTGKVVAATLASLALAVAFSTTAQAAPGDQVLARGTNALELATDACKAANFRYTVEGSPDTPNNYTIFVDSVTDPTCTTRFRFTGVKDGAVFTTPFATTEPGQPGATRVENAERCSIEFGVQRQDGSYFTQYLVPEGAATAPPQCP